MTQNLMTRTGTKVHAAHKGQTDEDLDMGRGVAACGTNNNRGGGLFPTSRPVTCEKCLSEAFAWRAEN